MEKERRIKGLSIVALLIAVIGLTIAFAAMNRTLTINNTTAKVGKFNVKFVTDSTVFSTNTNYDYKFFGDSGTNDESSQSASHISSDGSTVSNLSVSFDSTGLKARYMLKIENDSDMDVMVNNITLPTQCDDSNDKLECELKELGDATALASIIDGEQTKDNIDLQGNVTANSTRIAAGGHLYVSFNITAKNDDSVVGTTSDQTYSGLMLTVTFVQTEASQGNMTPDSQGGDEIIVDGNALTYPISGTLDNGITYNFASNGTLTLGGASTIHMGQEDYDKNSLSGLIEEKIGVEEFASIASGSSSYQSLYNDFYNEFESDEECMTETNMTRAQFASEAVGALANIVPVTKIIFTNDVTTVDILTNGIKAGFDSVTEIEFLSRPTSYPSSQWNGANIDVSMPEND